MKADEQNPLDKNDLAEGLTALADRAKRGEFLTPKGYMVIGGIALAVVLYFFWQYSVAESRRTSAKAWEQLENAHTAPALAELAKTATGPTQRIARLQEARVWVGPDGVNKLTALNPEIRQKAIESIEKARDQFAKLAEEFRDDLTLKAQCLDAASKAELALVGITKPGTISDSRGSVEKSVEFLRQLVKLVGEDSELGKTTKQRADELEAKKQEILQVGMALHNKFPIPTPPPPKIELPKNPLETVAPPIIPLPPLTPPATTPTPAPPAPEKK
ncbi:MAG: hypothetical protein ACRCZF_00540 [Gemmataceae bacterium]